MNLIFVVEYFVAFIILFSQGNILLRLSAAFRGSLPKWDQRLSKQDYSWEKAAQSVKYTNTSPILPQYSETDFTFVLKKSYFLSCVSLRK